MSLEDTLNLIQEMQLVPANGIEHSKTMIPDKDSEKAHLDLISQCAQKIPYP
jgi:hypothetical protein